MFDLLWCVFLSRNLLALLSKNLMIILLALLLEKEKILPGNNPAAAGSE
jgi:hypothetical protein